MSAHMKKLHTNKEKSNRILYILDHDNVYAIPKNIAQKYIVDVKKPVKNKENVSAEEVFKDIDEKYGEAASLLRGLRARENLTQMKFAKKINVSQANLSKMENGTRPIGKTVAMRIAKAFNVSYKYFF